jgi:soluble lytic murein transglycosylase-like protein
MGAALKRLLLLLVALLPLTACTPGSLEALVAWVHQQQDDAAAAGLPCPELADAVAWRGLPEHFLFVIERESHCTPTAVNRSSGALGLTQIMPFWLRYLCPMGIACTHDDLLAIEANLDAAAVVYAEQGWAAWSQTW